MKILLFSFASSFKRSASAIGILTAIERWVRGLITLFSMARFCARFCLLLMVLFGELIGAAVKCAFTVFDLVGDVVSLFAQVGNARRDFGAFSQLR